MEELVKNIFDKVSEYEIFNTLFPGVVFAWIFEKITQISIMTDSMLEDIFIYYFLGMIINRIGSVFIEGIFTLKNKNGKFLFVSRADYGDYLIAEKDDKKLEVLNSKNNVYRTLIALLLVIFITYISYLNGLFVAENTNSIVRVIIKIIIIVGLLILFVLSYKKQTKYIKDRVEKNENVKKLKFREHI